MNKEKVIEVKAVSETGELIASFGRFEKDDIQRLIDVATKQNMSCLSFINLPRNMYFNELQARDIKKEVFTLTKHKELSQNLLKSIEQAADVADKEEAFVKFEVLQF